MERNHKAKLCGDAMPTQEEAPILRDEKGRWLKGSTGQHALMNYNHNQWRQKMVNEFRKSVSEKDFNKIVKKVVKQALAGNKWASLEILERVMGKEGLNVNIESNNEIIWTIKFDNDGLDLVKPVESTIIDSETNTEQS